MIEALFAADVAVEDVESKDGTVTVFTPPAEFYSALAAGEIPVTPSSPP